MRGTLALWYEPNGPSADDAGVAGEKPSVELHLNLWRDIPGWTNALDIGLRLKNVAALRRFYLYIPAVIQREHVEDLAPVLRIGSALKAVFNDIVKMGSETDASYGITVGDDLKMQVFFVRTDDVLIDHFKEDDQTTGSRLVFTETLCGRIKASETETAYIRMRIALIGPTADLFSSERVAADRLFSSAVGRLELTEIRLNERRSYPPRILELANGHDFNITTVQYFLIRDLEHHLVVQHAPFRKVRRLEPNLWADYLAGDTSPRRFRLGARAASRLVIYHWREQGKDASALRNFIAFASFTSSSTSLVTYAAVIVLLGAIGSSVAAALSLILERSSLVSRYLYADCKSDSNCKMVISDWTSGVIFLIIIAVLVACIWSVGKIRKLGR